MSFDAVHDTQLVHRALVKAFSFPCTPVSIAAVLGRCPEGLPATLAAVALTLLDAETTYAHTQSLLTEWTGARRRDGSQAAFVFVSEAGDGAWAHAAEQARVGTLADPHEGATVVAWAPVALSGRWTASGPGIERPFELSLPGSGGWVEARNRACAEFPLGIDVIWARDDGTVVAVPRTTRLVEARGV